jgi:hypothetical protein
MLANSDSSSSISSSRYESASSRISSEPESSEVDSVEEVSECGLNGRNWKEASHAAFSTSSLHVSPLDAEYSNMVEVEGNVHVINAFLDKVGMGRYQWHLWVLCGFGWIADQMLLQMLAVIQPRVQAEFNLDGFKVGGITTSFFAGLAAGASFWGIGADIWGRKLAFNCTLLTAGVFGLAMGGQMNYAGLCGIAAAIATGTGGNLPLDGAIYLEASPRVNQRCLMLMSIFWCIGQRKGFRYFWC